MLFSGPHPKVVMQVALHREVISVITSLVSRKKDPGGFQIANRDHLPNNFLVSQAVYPVCK